MKKNMKIGIISDFHFGDKGCVLADIKGIKPKYTELLNGIIELAKYVGNGYMLDFLILAGDIFDFSVSSFENSINIGKHFFQKIHEDHLAEQIIFIPGNHDKFIWDAVEWESNIMMKLKNHENVRRFKGTQPGLIDMTSSDETFSITGVRKPYGKLFLEGLFPEPHEQISPISVVYPNLYVKTGKGNILITHGHFLELAWVLLSELFTKSGFISDQPGLKEIEEYNRPVSSLICTGLGQGGSISEMIFQLQDEIKRKKLANLEQIMDKSFFPNLDRLLDYKCFKELITDLGIWAAKKIIFNIAKDYKDTRYFKDLFESERTLERFERFYRASEFQASELGLNSLDTMIFGHTHCPFINLVPKNRQKPVMYNTGGWLENNDNQYAEIILIDGADDSIKNLSVFL